MPGAGFAGKDRIVTLSVLWGGTFFVAEVALIVLGLAAVDAIVGDFVILPLPEAGAPRFGEVMRDLRASARRRDLQRAVIDCMIAVAAIEHGAVLVSGDALFPRLARRAPTLRVVNWAAD